MQALAVAEVYRGELGLNLTIVESGQATVYPSYCDDPAYYQAEQRAKVDGLGVWGSTGEHQRPWEWRQR